MEESSFTIPADDTGDTELDPRIQVELEKLNAATDEINKLELEFDESTKRFHLLLGDTSRRLQALTRRLGPCVDRSRPYHEAVAAAAQARTDCQKAAVQFQRASELHAAARDTVSLAEQRFDGSRDARRLDPNWQEVLSRAVIKVMDAEKRKADSGRAHQLMAAAYIAAERKATQLEESLKRNIIKSRIYFEEKKLCDEQLRSQNERIDKLQQLIADAKGRYAASLRALEDISDDIHRSRGEHPPGAAPVGPREPGVGAERDPAHDEQPPDEQPPDERSLAALRLRVRELALQPADTQDTDEAWALELNDTINRLDQLLMIKESTQQRSKFTASSPRVASAPPSGAARGRDPPGDAGSDPARGATRGREAPGERRPLTPGRAKSMMSLDVLSLARDAAAPARESYLQAVIEGGAPEPRPEPPPEPEGPDDVLTVELAPARPPVVRMAPPPRADDLDDS